MPLQPLARQSAEARSPKISAERMVNLYAEVSPKDGRAILGLYGTPGLKDFAICGSGPLRDAIVMGEYVYAVSGGEVYRVASDGTATLCTGSVNSSGAVSMATNGTQIVIVVAPADAYVVTGTAVSAITDPDFPGATSVTYMDGYFVFSGPQGTGRFFISGLLDGTSYDALDFATAEGDPDPAVRVFADHRELWVFGTTSTEIWQNTGAADFPFARVDGAYMERGCAAGLSPAKADNTVYWLGNDRIVYRADGYVPKRASTHAIEHQLQQMAIVSDARGWTYAQDGHTFYVLKFPAEGRTFVFDISNGLWHERQSGTGLTGEWRVNTGLAAFGNVLACDDWSGNLYELALETYTEDGSAIRRAFDSYPGADPSGNKRVTVSGIEIVFEAGVGLLAGQGVDPQVALSWSDDDGATWSAERWRSIGPLGQRLARARWLRLGSARSRIFRVMMTDPVKVAIVGFVPVAQEMAA